jgi:LysR family transcriptional regulator, nod-box dependent transcriptional activator
MLFGGSLMRLNRLDLNLTVCLDALLAEGNVSRAAARVFVSQPAMSVALRRLREYFKDELLVPAGRQYRLSPFAESLQKPVRDVILQMRAISDWRPSFEPAESDRKITIEASDYIATVFMPEVFKLAYARAPGMRFELRLLAPNYRENLDSGEIDLLIIPDAVSSGAHPRDVLFTDTFSCVVWKGNNLVKRRVTRAQYLQLGHVICEWDGGRMEAMDETLLAHSGLHRRRQVTAPSFSLAPQLVVGTERVATVQTRLAEVMARSWPIRVLPCPVKMPAIVETVQWHKYQERDPAIQWFLEVLRIVAKTLGSSRSAPSVGRPSDSEHLPHRFDRS